ncbi:MAG: hypothetical protein ABI036_13365 [Fibrobacteria bacterium]
MGFLNRCFPISRPAPLFAALFLASAFAGTAAAKSPEDFVGSAPAPNTASLPAADSGKPAPGKPSKTAKPAKSAAKAPMDTVKLHATYLDGDFDQATRAMEGALKNRKSLTHGDSVFIFKHLGVMYAATPATREKGRYYMAQLIYIEPTAKILDMYASDMIDIIFRKVREEVESKHPVAAKAPEPAPDTVKPLPPPPPPALPAPQVARSKKSKTMFWVTGGAVVAAGTVGLLYVLLDDPKPKQHNIALQE